ncbi:MAG TPA: type II toxin-antitoxin system HicA family toxin [Thermoanaerobaculia bacterium]|nr:type II toxin-antitoxin system HicA family toxin [Thermoanaerobaculia bacterium]
MKSVSGAEFCRALARKGWQYVRTRGSHQTWSKQGSGQVTVPVHAGKTLGRGLLASLLKQAGLSEKDL